MNARTLLLIITAASLVLPLSACGHKGKLKTPAQIEKIESKKAAKAAKKQNSEYTPPLNAPTE